MKATWRLSPKERNKIPLLYRQGKTICTLAKTFKVTDQAIYGILCRRNEPIRTLSQSKQRYKCNFNFFHKINSEPRAYWLGFIAADGCISIRKTSQAVLVLMLAIKDVGHIREFKAAIEATHPILNYRQNGHWASRICITSDKMINDLKRLDFTSRKRQRCIFPKIPHRLLNHFMRGYFDGDGSIGSGRNPMFRVVGYPRFIRKYQQHLRQACNLRRTKWAWRFGTPAIVYVGRKQMVKIQQFLYHGATIFLARKYQIFQEITLSIFARPC